jgi:hypothetical protein
MGDFSGIEPEEPRTGRGSLLFALCLLAVVLLAVGLGMWFYSISFAD